MSRAEEPQRRPEGGRSRNFLVTFMFPFRMAVKKTRHKIPPLYNLLVYRWFHHFFKCLPKVIFMFPLRQILYARRNLREQRKSGGPRGAPHPILLRGLAAVGTGRPHPCAACRLRSWTCGLRVHPPHSPLEGRQVGSPEFEFTAGRTRQGTEIQGKRGRWRWDHTPFLPPWDTASETAPPPLPRLLSHLVSCSAQRSWKAAIVWLILCFLGYLIFL